MFERTNRDISFAPQEMFFTQQALMHRRNSLLAHAGFTDLVDGLIVKLARRGAGRLIRFNAEEYEELVVVLRNYLSAACVDGRTPEGKALTDFVQRVVDTPDRAGRKGEAAR